MNVLIKNFYGQCYQIQKLSHLSIYQSKVVHIYDVERNWSGANEHYTNRILSNIDYSYENLEKAENPKYIVCLLYQAVI
jgi:hypothetical protein